MIPNRSRSQVEYRSLPNEVGNNIVVAVGAVIVRAEVAELEPGVSEEAEKAHAGVG
jgi:hypothetical protein